MCKNAVNCFILAALATPWWSPATAQENKPAATKAADAKHATTADNPSAEKVGKAIDKPQGAPDWALIEADWWYPLRNDFAKALHSARELYRAGQEEAAAGEIEKAVAWLKYAQTHADLTTQEDLSTARVALDDFLIQLKSGVPVRAMQLESAFADASAALAKHHHFLANKALADDDLKTAGRHLMAAADHLRDAARSANHEYGSEIVEIYEHYSPFGFWDESIALERTQLEANLQSVQAELRKLASKLKAQQ
jgi:hypothetical protein